MAIFQKATIKLCVLLSSVVVVLSVILLLYTRHAEYTLLTHVLDGPLPSSITIQHMYPSGSIFESSHVFQFSHEKNGPSDILSRGFTQGGEPGVEFVIQWIENEIEHPLDISKGWILFRNRVEGKDLYYIVSEDQTSSYLLVFVY